MQKKISKIPKVKNFTHPLIQAQHVTFVSGEVSSSQDKNQDLKNREIILSLPSVFFVGKKRVKNLHNIHVCDPAACIRQCQGRHGEHFVAANQWTCSLREKPSKNP